MALITNLESVDMERVRVHGPVDCTYTVFTAVGGQKYIQLNTFGSANRENPGKQSQTIQLDESAVKQLIKIFAKDFL